jgi:hypothetical protein
MATYRNGRIGILFHASSIFMNDDSRPWNVTIETSGVVINRDSFEQETGLLRQQQSK